MLNIHTMHTYTSQYEYSTQHRECRVCIGSETLKVLRKQMRAASGDAGTWAECRVGRKDRQVPSKPLAPASSCCCVSFPSSHPLLTVLLPITTSSFLFLCFEASVFQARLPALDREPHPAARSPSSSNVRPLMPPTPGPLDLLSPC